MSLYQSFSSKNFPCRFVAWTLIAVMNLTLYAPIVDAQSKKTQRFVVAQANIETPDKGVEINDESSLERQSDRNDPIPIHALPAPYSASVSSAFASKLAEAEAGFTATREAERFQLAQSSSTGNLQTMLNNALDYETSGDSVNAALTYFSILDQHPGTSGSSLSYRRLNRFSQQVIRGELSFAQVREFMNALPTWENCQSAESKYIFIGLAYTRAEAAQRLGLTVVQENVNRWLLGAAEDLLLEYPNHPVQAFALRHYIQAARELDPEDRARAVTHLKNTIRSTGSQKLRWLAKAIVGEHQAEYAAKRDGARRLYTDLLGEYDAAGIEGILANPNVIDELKGWYLHYLGNAYLSRGDLSNAVDAYERILTHLPDAEELHQDAGFRRAFALEHLNSTDPNYVISVYQGFIDAYPQSAFADQALLRMARIYTLAGDYDYASLLYEDIINRSPGTSISERASNGLDYINENLVDSISNVAKTPIQYRLAKHFDQSCGTIALQHLLEAKGVRTTLASLNESAQTQENGTTMHGLVLAAAKHGVNLVGVDYRYRVLPETPFLAFVAPDHYVLAKKAGANAVVVQDMYTAPRRVERRVFDELWDGRALVIPSDIKTARKLDKVELLETVGGSGELDPYIPPANNPGSSSFGGSAGGTIGDLISLNMLSRGFPYGSPKEFRFPDVPAQDLPYGVSGGQGIGGRNPRYDGFGATTADLGLSGRMLQTSIDTAGVRVMIDALDFSTVVQETDLMSFSGDDFRLEFTRSFANPLGLARDAFDRLTPHENIIGHSWSHNFNFHLRPASNYTSVELYDEHGNTMTLNRTSTAGGVDTYSKDSIRIERNQSNGTFILYRPEGSEYGFSSEMYGGASSIFARLDWYKDKNANQFTLTYDDPDPELGYLTRVDTPSGNDQYLAFTYNANDLITKVELKDGSGVIDYVSYTYTANNDLASVRLNGQTSGINYAYTEAASGSIVKYFISSITDADSDVHTLNYLYANNQASSITLYLPNNDRAVFGRDTVSGIATVTVYDNGSGTAKEKFQYIPNGAGTRIADRRIYNSGTSSTYEAWLYTYNSDGDLTRVEAPSGTNAYATYTYTSDKKIKTVTQGDNATVDPTYTFTYSGSNEGPDTVTYKVNNVVQETTTYEYDAFGNVTNVTPAEFAGTSGITIERNGSVVTVRFPNGTTITYTYDSKGRITSVVNSCGDSTTYAYNKRGGITSIIENGATTTYTYGDNKHRKLPTLVTKTGEPSHTYTYDKKGNILTYVHNGATHALTYNKRNRLTVHKINNVSQRTITYEKGLIKSVWIISYGTVTYTYFGNRRVKSIVDSNAGTTTEYTYTNGSKVATKKVNGVPVSITDPDENPKEVAWGYTQVLPDPRPEPPVDPQDLVPDDACGANVYVEFGAGTDSVEFAPDLGGTITTYQSTQNVTVTTPYIEPETFADVGYTFSQWEITKLLQDDFNDNDFSGWRANGNWTAASGAMRNTAGPWAPLFDRDYYENDFSMEFKFTLYAGTAFIYPRFAGSGDRVLVTITNQEITIQEWQVGGSWVVLGSNNSPGITHGAVYTMKIITAGQNISVYRNGTLLASGVQSFALTNEFVGFQAYLNAEFAVDDIDIQSTWTTASNPVNNPPISTENDIHIKPVFTGTPPTASFTVSPNPVGIGLPVTFTDNSSPGSGSATWSWNFGDGGTASGSGNKSHSYTSINNFTPSLTVTNEFGSDVYTLPSPIVVEDQTAPVITLNGVSPMTVAHGGTYIELKASATDNVDVITDDEISISGDTVNTNVVDEYTVNYDVSDTAGNAAARVTRTVYVEDQTPPVITLNGSTPMTIAHGGIYTELKASATDNVDVIADDEISISGDTVNTNVVDEYTVNYDVSDSAGNAAARVTRTVNVTDQTAPVITLSGANPQTITLGESYVELNATATDAVEGDLTGSIVIDASAVNANLAGVYTVTYDVSDSMGNAAVQVTRTVNVEGTVGLEIIPGYGTVEFSTDGGPTPTVFNTTQDVSVITGAIVPEAFPSNPAEIFFDHWLVGSTHIFDAFEDGVAMDDGWVPVTGAWLIDNSTTSPALANVYNGSINSIATIDPLDSDGEIKFEYINLDTTLPGNGLEVYLRYEDANNFVRMGMYPDYMELVESVGGVPSTLATNDFAGSIQDARYSVRAFFDGTSVEIHRLAEGGPESQMLKGNVSVVGSVETEFEVKAAAQFLIDNVDILSATIDTNNPAASITMDASITLRPYFSGTPIAGIAADVTIGTAPLTVQFMDATDPRFSPVTIWDWDLDGDTFQDSPDQHPPYTFTDPGTYTPSLLVTNAHGSDTYVMPTPITVTASPIVDVVGSGTNEDELDTGADSTVNIQVQLTPISANNEITVDFSVLGSSTATEGVDFTVETASPLTFAPGEGAKSITITVHGDDDFEGDEDIDVQLSNATNAVLNSADYTVTIVDDETIPVVRISSIDFVIDEFDNAAKSIDVDLSNSTGMDVDVFFTITGTSDANDRTILTASPLTIIAGAMSGSVDFTVDPDAVYEGDETFIVTLDAVSTVDAIVSTVPGEDTHTTTITDDESEPTVTIDTTLVAVDETNVAVQSVDVNLSHESQLPVTIPFAIGGGAEAGVDYTLNTASPLIINSGTSLPIQFTVQDDALFEINQDITMTLGAATNGVLGSPSAHAVTITDDDLNPASYPTAGFRANLIAVTTGADNQFIDESLGGDDATVTGWDWDFGDGETSTEQNPIHVYTTLGWHEVSLEVTNSNLLTDSEVKTSYVFVGAVPTATFTVSTASVNVGDSVTLNWTSSGMWNMTITPDPGKIKQANFASGSAVVTPKNTTTYTMYATNDITHADAVVISHTVTVNATVLPIDDGTWAKPYETFIPPDSTVENYDEERFSLMVGDLIIPGGVAPANIDIVILDHPQYGTAHPDANGDYTLPVEGGRDYTICIMGADIIRADRQIAVGYEEFAPVDTIELMQKDTSTQVSFDPLATDPVIHTSTEINGSAEGLGNRKVTVVMAPDTRVFQTDGNGNDLMEIRDQAVNVSVTEYPTPESMPASLPPTSAFTWCGEFKVEGLDHVRFNKPVVFYIENFLSFPIGHNMPIGYYNRETGLWEAQENGIVGVLVDGEAPFDGVVDGLDTDNDGVGDGYDITGAESLGIGTQVWRGETSHFTPIDCNDPVRLEKCAEGPNAQNNNNEPSSESKDPCADLLSQIYAIHALGNTSAAAPVSGTGSNLNYSSELTQTPREAANDFLINLIQDIPLGCDDQEVVEGIYLSVHAAGQVFEKYFERSEFDAFENFPYSWDGNDRYGNPVEGPLSIAIDIGYAYKAVYTEVPAGLASTSSAFSLAGTTFTVTVEARDDVVLWDRYYKNLPGKISESVSKHAVADGWSIDGHHRIDPKDPSVLYKGDGTQLTHTLPDAAIIAGGHGFTYVEGQDAADAYLQDIAKMAVDSEGDVYFYERHDYRLKKLDAETNTIYTVAGTGIETDSPNFGGSHPDNVNGNNIDPLTMNFDFTSLVIDANDNVYFSSDRNGSFGTPDRFDVDLYKLTPDGLLYRISHLDDYQNDWEVPENGSSAQIIPFLNVNTDELEYAVDRAGNVYMPLWDANCIIKIDTTNKVYVIAGQPDEDYDGVPNLFDEDLPATQNYVLHPEEIAVDDEGNVYYLDYVFNTEMEIKKIDVNGFISVVNFDSVISGHNASLDTFYVYPKSLEVDADGALYFFDSDSYRIYKINPDGEVELVAGIPNPLQGVNYDTKLHEEDNLPASRRHLKISSMDVNHAGEVYFATDFPHGHIFKMQDASVRSDLALPDSELLFPDPNGSGYIFDDDTGQHLRTIDLDTGVTLLTFQYTPDSNGDDRLTSMTDLFDNVTVIARNGAGIPQTVTSPDGIVTTLSFDVNGNLSQVSYPDPEGGVIATSYTYYPGGLLESVTDPEGRVSGYVYDDDGRVIELRDGDGGEWFWERSETEDSHTTVITEFVTHDATPVVMETTIVDTFVSHLEKITEITYPNGDTSTTMTYKSIGKTVVNSPCGQTVETIVGTDPRYGYQVTVSEKVTLPDSSFTATVETSTDYSDSDSDGTMDLIAEMVTVVDPVNQLNSRTATIITDLSDNQIITVTTTSPESISTINELDADTLLVQKITSPGLHDTYYEYDEDNDYRIITISQGPDSSTPFEPGTVNRLVRYEYVPEGSNGAGYVATTESNDEPATKVTYAYDEIGRVISQTFSDGRVISYDLSKLNDLETITIPTGVNGDEVDHEFTYLRTNTIDTYTTPTNRISNDQYKYDFHDNGMPSSATTPENKTTNMDLGLGVTGTINYNGMTANLIEGRLNFIDLPGAEGKIYYTYLEENKPDTISLDRDEDGTPEETATYEFDGNLPTKVTYGGTLSEVVETFYNDLDFTVESTIYAGISESIEYDRDGLATRVGDFTIARAPATGWVNSITDSIFNVLPGISQFGEVSTMGFEISNSPVADWSLTYNNLGMIETKSDTVNNVTRPYVYVFDDLGQLETVTDGTNVLENYNYDTNGNRKDSFTAKQGARTFAYDDDDRLLGWDGEDVDSDFDVEYEYDKDGYLTKKIEAINETSYDYSSRGELLKVVFPDNSRIEYIHGVNGQRLARRKYDSSGVLQVNETEKYLWAGSTLLAIYDDQNALQTRFEYADGRNPIAMVQAGSKYYLTYDQVGSLRAVYDDQGVLQGEIVYDSFGNELSNTLAGEMLIPFGFAGGISDRETGLVRFGYRDYDPGVGRWTAKDPIFFEGGQNNLYVYVNNNPIMLVDPTGLNALVDFIAGQKGDVLDQILGSASNFAAGFGDTLTGLFGLTDLVGLPSLTDALRDKWGLNDFVDKCSEAFRNGEYGAYGWLAAATLAGGHAYLTKNIPQNLTHFTTPAGYEAIMAEGVIRPGAGLFGKGVYATTVGRPLNLFVPNASRVPILLPSNQNVVRIIPKLVYVKYGKIFL
jgi:RHS repeat-associated protein